MILLLNSSFILLPFPESAVEKREFVPSPKHDPSVAGEDGVRELLYALGR